MDDIKTLLEIGAMIIGAIIWTFGIIWRAQKYVKKKIQAYHDAQELLRVERSKLYSQQFQDHKEEVDRFIVKMMDFEDQVDEAEKKYMLQINTLENKVEFLENQ